MTTENIKMSQFVNDEKEKVEAYEKTLTTKQLVVYTLACQSLFDRERNIEKRIDNTGKFCLPPLIASTGVTGLLGVGLVAMKANILPKNEQAMGLLVFSLAFQVGSYVFYRWKAGTIQVDTMELCEDTALMVSDINKQTYNEENMQKILEKRLTK